MTAAAPPSPKTRAAVALTLAPTFDETIERFQVTDTDDVNTEHSIEHEVYVRSQYGQIPDHPDDRVGLVSVKWRAPVGGERLGRIGHLTLGGAPMRFTGSGDDTADFETDYVALIALRDALSDIIERAYIHGMTGYEDTASE